MVHGISEEFLPAAAVIMQFRLDLMRKKFKHSLAAAEFKSALHLLKLFSETILQFFFSLHLSGRLKSCI